MAFKTIEDFIRDSRNVHGDKYDYSKSEYVNARTKLIITCPKHGDFLQTPTNHLSGCGCPKCKTDKLKSLFSSTREEFLQKAKAKHGDKYDYSNVSYVNNRTNIDVICKKHGPFKITPNNHLKGEGCPMCRESRLEREVRGMLEGERVDFISQWRLPWNKRMSLDFYIPSKRAGIECQGIQHFEKLHFFEPLESLQARDARKLEECKERGIDVVWYTDLGKDGCIGTKDELIEHIRGIRNQ